MDLKINLRLLVSSMMTEKKEHQYIRFSRRVRERLQLTDRAVILGKGHYEVQLTSKQAYKQDIQKLARLLKQGKLSEEEAEEVGFVSRATQQKLDRRPGEDIWISQGLSAITIGADPEFGLINGDGQLVRGNHLIGHEGPFGSDGPGVEVRPNPSQSHIEVVNGIGKILQNPPENVDGFLWKGGATHQDSNRTYWFGGHIHLGRPAAIAQEDAPGCYIKIATILDSLLALPMVKWDMENPQLRRQGCKFGYGKAGDIRYNFPNRFEYRVLSGLWLINPILAQIVLGSAKAITESAYHQISNSNYDYDWVSAPASRKSLLKNFNIKHITETSSIINTSKVESVTTDLIKEWENRVRNIDYFDKYRPELEALIALTKAPRETVVKQLNLDLRANWLEGLPLLPKGSKNLKAALEAVEAN